MNERLFKPKKTGGLRGCRGRDRHCRTDASSALIEDVETWKKLANYYKAIKTPIDTEWKIIASATSSLKSLSKLSGNR